MTAHALVALRHRARGADDVIIKIVPEFQEFLVRRVLGRDPVAEADPRDPDHLRSCHLKELFIDHHARKKQRCILPAHPECLLDLCLIHRDKARIELVKALSRDSAERFSVILIPEQIKDIFSDPDQMFDLLILQVHLFIVFQLIVHHLSDEIPVLLHRRIDVLKSAADPQNTERQIFRGHKKVLVEKRDLHASKSHIHDRGPLLDILIKLIIRDGDRLVSQESLLRVADDTDLDAGADADLIENDPVVSRLTHRTRRIGTVFRDLVGFHDPGKPRKYIAELFHHLIADLSVVVSIAPKRRDMADMVQFPDPVPV